MKRRQAAISARKASQPWRIGIVASRWHSELIDLMVEDAIDVLVKSGIPRTRIWVHHAPGSFEVPLIGAELAHRNHVDALIGFGIVLQGETLHAQLLSTACAQAMMDIQVQTGIPFAFEILHVMNIGQAKARASGVRGKGREAALAALGSLEALHLIRGAKTKK